jgi:hypothetical protein
LFFGFLRGFFSATSAGSAVSDFAPSHNAPAAAATFSPTPTQVVPRRPSVGTSQKPAASAPSAAPAVFDAYSDPVPEKEARSLSRDASQAAAIGKVAPIAAAGMPRSARLITTRTIAKRAGAAPSAYAQARSGVDALNATGRRSAVTATRISSAAYARRGVRRLS